MKYLVCLLAVFYLVACSPKTGKELAGSKQTPVEVSNEPPLVPPPPSIPEPETLAEEASLVASMEKRPCFGNCPVYELKVYDDGFVTFYGKAFVPKIGKYRAIASKSKIVDLMILAEEINYFSFNDQYPDKDNRIMYEFPVTVTYLKMEGQEKIIQNRHDGPVSLKRFEKIFESLFMELNWEKDKR
ncbi:MAG: DUF6438 domain-containing protein [Bacteroidota bacterium]